MPLAETHRAHTDKPSSDLEVTASAALQASRAVAQDKSRAFWKACVAAPSLADFATKATDADVAIHDLPGSSAPSRHPLRSRRREEAGHDARRCDDGALAPSLDAAHVPQVLGRGPEGMPEQPEPLPDTSADGRADTLRRHWAAAFTTPEVQQPIIDALLRDCPSPVGPLREALPAAPDVAAALRRSRQSALGPDALPHSAWRSAGMDGARPLSRKNSDIETIAAASTYAVREDASDWVDSSQRGFLKGREAFANVIESDPACRAAAVADDVGSASPLPLAILWETSQRFSYRCHGRTCARSSARCRYCARPAVCWRRFCAGRLPSSASRENAALDGTAPPGCPEVATPAPSCSSSAAPPPAPAFAVGA